MYDIKTINSEKEINDVYEFFTSIFYEESVINNEKYYDMSDRLIDMKKIYDIDKSFLLYMEDKGKIIAALTGKNLDKDKITIGVLAVDKDYRRMGLAKKLVNEFEERCKKKGIKHIDLGARSKACSLYSSCNYTPYLMIQINDSNIDIIRNNNKYNLKENKSFSSSDYSYIIYYVDSIKEEYIKCFESIENAYSQYIFEKNL